MAQKQSSERKTEITPEYVNNKLEQILSALFDTLKERLDGLYKFQKEVVPKTKWGLNVEYDLWYNTNELSTIRTWLYTDFLGKGIFFRVITEGDIFHKGRRG